MSMSFQLFAGPPTLRPSSADDLYNHVGGRETLKPGILELGEIDVPSHRGAATVTMLALTMMEARLLNTQTDGRLFEFTDGESGDRCFYLGRRLDKLTRLKEKVAVVRDGNLKLFLEVLIKNFEHALDLHGERAILAIS